MDTLIATAIIGQNNMKSPVLLYEREDELHAAAQALAAGGSSYDDLASLVSAMAIAAGREAVRVANATPALTVTELQAERAKLLARVEIINRIIEDLSAPAKAVHIRTHRNLKNSGLNGLAFTDNTLTKFAELHHHDAWVSAATIADLRNRGEIDSNWPSVEVIA